jgi:hypothetical protein
MRRGEVEIRAALSKLETVLIQGSFTVFEKDRKEISVKQEYIQVRGSK